MSRRFGSHVLAATLVGNWQDEEKKEERIGWRMRKRNEEEEEGR